MIYVPALSAFFQSSGSLALFSGEFRITQEIVGQLNIGKPE
jgi:hypothetical protein